MSEQVLNRYVFVFHPFLLNATHKGLLKILDMQSLLLSLDVLYCAKSCKSSSVMTSGHLAHTSRTALRLQSTNSALHVLATGATFQKPPLSFDFTIHIYTFDFYFKKSSLWGNKFLHLLFRNIFNHWYRSCRGRRSKPKTFTDGLEKSVQPQGPS